MAREKELFRENLEAINARFPAKETLNYEEICVLFGYSKSTAIRNWKSEYNRRIGGVPKATIARAMCH
jgi:hypothetical protein